jgi:pilus assembly protein Flp/PilA
MVYLMMLLNQLKGYVSQIKKDEDGAALIEYTVLLGILLIAVIAIIGAVGVWINGQVNHGRGRAVGHGCVPLIARLFLAAQISAFLAIVVAAPALGALFLQWPGEPPRHRFLRS